MKKKKNERFGGCEGLSVHMGECASVEEVIECLTMITERPEMKDFKVKIGGGSFNVSFMNIDCYEKTISFDPVVSFKDNRYKNPGILIRHGI